MRHVAPPLAFVLLAGLVLAPPATRAEPDDVPRPEGWLWIAPVEDGGRSPFRASPVFDRHLARPDAPPPAAGQVVRGTTGRTAAWEAAAPGEARGALWAHATVRAPRAGVWLVRPERVAAVFVGRRAVAGDVYGHGITRTPVALPAGETPLFAAGFRGTPSIVFERPPKPAFVDDLDPTLPDLVPGETIAPHAAVVLVHASERVAGPWTVEARVEAGTARASATLRVQEVAPLARWKVPLVLPPLTVPPDAEAARLVVLLSDGERVLDERAFPLALRRGVEPRRRTFVSAIDGSVQEWAHRPAAPGGEGPDGLVLSLHGAGVDAYGQARAYAPREGFHVAAPTNRRPFGFDWQDWGRRDAYEALADALARTGVDRRRVWLTGHSMGGHGTWHLAVNDPDGFGVAAPSAGWVSFDTYGGRGAAPGPLDRLWRAADPGADTLALVENLKDVPVRMLHGADDETVPVEEARRMAAALEGVATDVRLDVVPGKGHWWDGDAAAGADCVDWPAFFEAFAAHPIPRDPASLLVVVPDPALDDRHHWLSVTQRLTFDRPARAEARREDDALRVDTENVRRLALDPPPAWETRRVVLDGETHAVEGPPPWGWLRGAGGWSRSTPRPPAGERRPGRSGLFKRLFDRSFVLVYGTAGDDTEDQRALARARFDAERWLYRANGHASLVSDTAFLAAGAAPNEAYRERNVVLYGNADTNAAWDAVLSPRCPLRLARGRATLGGETFEGDDLAAFFLHPRRGSDAALAGAVAWTGPAGERATVLSRYLASGTGYPDYLLFSKAVLARGETGVRRAGLFTVTWDLAE